MLCFTEAFSNEFCEKYGLLLQYPLIIWKFNSCLYFSCITRNNDLAYNGKSLRFMFKEIVTVREICQA